MREFISLKNNIKLNRLEYLLNHGLIYCSYQLTFGWLQIIQMWFSNYCIATIVHVFLPSFLIAESCVTVDNRAKCRILFLNEFVSKGFALKKKCVECFALFAFYISPRVVHGIQIALFFILILKNLHPESLKITWVYLLTPTFLNTPKDRGRHKSALCMNIHFESQSSASPQHSKLSSLLGLEKWPHMAINSPSGSDL